MAFKDDVPRLIDVQPRSTTFAKVELISENHRMADFGAPIWYARDGHWFKKFKPLVPLGISRRSVFK
jgi:hypothetical protein